MLKRSIWSCVPSVRLSSAYSRTRSLATIGTADCESELRENLAAAYRVTANYGWSPDLIYNHISVRCGGTDDDPHFLLNPYGLGYEEVTASSLVKVDGKGNVVDPGSATGVVNGAGFVVHSAIHLARPDLHAVMHTHEKDAAAVSAMECGLLPLTQDAMVFGEVRRHQYEGIAIDDGERARLASDLGATSKVMLLDNHGVLVGGSTIAEMMTIAYFVHKACSVQVSVMAAVGGRMDGLRAATPDSVAKAKAQAAAFNSAQGNSLGVLEWQYLRRRLDSTDASYKN